MSVQELKVVNLCCWGSTSYSLVQTLLLYVSFSYSTQHHRQTDIWQYDANSQSYCRHQYVENGKVSSDEPLSEISSELMHLMCAPVHSRAWEPPAPSAAVDRFRSKFLTCVLWLKPIRIELQQKTSKCVTDLDFLGSTVVVMVQLQTVTSIHLPSFSIFIGYLGNQCTKFELATLTHE